MTRKHDFEDDDYKTFRLEGTLEQRVKAWTKYAAFNHVGPICSDCGKAKYAFDHDDVEGFCVKCFNKRWPHPVRESAQKKERDEIGGMKLDQDK